MIRSAALLLAIAMFAASAPAAAQSASQESLTIACGKSVTLEIAGATAAYALDPSVADAGAQNGTVTIRAVGAGRTAVVVVTAGANTTLYVVVPAPKAAAAIGGSGSGGDESTRDSGTVEGGYASAGGEFTGSVEMERREGATFRRLSFVGAAYVAPNAGQSTAFPLLSYEVGGPGYDVTYLDKSLSISPLTFTDVLVRGVHVQNGLWSFHAGASSVAQFAQYLIPTNPQWTAGITRAFKLSSASRLSANLYDIVNPAGATVSTSGGVLGSLLYSYDPSAHEQAQAELGLSRSLGYAAQAHYDDRTQNFDASVLEKPSDFASLATDARQGFFANLNYDRTFSDRLTAQINMQQQDYELPGFHENTLVGQSSATYALDKTVSLTAGALYSSYDSLIPPQPYYRTLALPLGAQFSSRHLSAGLQYQPTTDFSGTYANGYSANLGVDYGPLTAGAFYHHNVNIPTIASIFSDVPGLQAALEQAGVNIGDPAQLGQLLGNVALLAKLGFPGLQLNLAPTRDDEGLSAAWTRGGLLPQQLAFSYLNSDAELARGSFAFHMALLSYSRTVAQDTRISASVGLLQSRETGAQGSNVARNPTYAVDLTRRLSSLPDFLFPQKRGSIGGRVFEDDGASGRCTAQSLGLANVEVTLDGRESVRTDARGRYLFTHVPYGAHQVAARIAGTRPFFFTTDSPANARLGETVDIGVSFVAGKLFGTVTNDAGEGIGGAQVQVAGLGRAATTDDDGSFSLNGIGEGRYAVSISPDSLPPGYDLASLVPASIEVRSGVPAQVHLTVRALRSISGKVTFYNPQRGRFVPAPRVDISIPQLHLTNRTDANGAYAFRGLPAGTFTVTVDGGGPSETRSVTLPAQPATLTNVDLRVVPPSWHARVPRSLHGRVHHRRGRDLAGRGNGRHHSSYSPR